MGIKTTSKEQNHWMESQMESHPEQMERDFPGCKRRCVALRRMALEPQYVAAKATLKKALEGSE